MMSSKIIGFYRCKDDDGSDLYIYVTKLPSGKLDYNFTKDFDEAASMAAKFCNSSDYTKDNYENIVNDPDRFNLNCKNVDEVLERIKRANPDEKINDDDFDAAIDDYDKDEEGIFTRIKEKISNSKFGTKVKNLWLNKKVKKVAFGAVATLTALGIASCSLNSCSGPTANNSRIATVDDTDDKDKTEEEDKAKEEKETKEKEETKTTDTTATETTASNANYSSTNSGSSSSNNTSSNVTSTPGSTNEDMNEFQDPDASLDDSNNQGGGSEEGNEQPEDPFDNVIEGEEPVDDNDNDNNNNNNNSEDEDYSEEIEVDVPGDNNTDTDDDYSEEIIIEEPEDSNINDNEEDNNYEDDELTEGDIDFDEGYENDPSVDDDYTFDPNYTNDGSSDYEIIYGELPDPNDTAADGDYVSDEEEITNDEPIEVTDTDTIDDSDIVPVYQEETTYTEDTASLPQNTIENSNTDLESAVDQAIEVMANGGDASITYDANTGQYSTEVTTTNTYIEENGLTK